MNTTFSLQFAAEDAARATGIARECFEKLEYLENKLSRYREGSDVWQINRLQSGDLLFVSEDCYACLRLAMAAYQDTGGLFDITLGRQIEHLKDRPTDPPPPLKGQLLLDPERPAVHCIAAGREIDLGGIGKGFALEAIRDILEGWNIPSGLIAAGPSTQRAFGKRSWPVQLSGDRHSHTLHLENQALSASGTFIQGSHLLSSREEAFTFPFQRAWVTAPNAAMADAWSTAAMLMYPPEIQRFLPEAYACFIEDEEGIRRVIS